MVSRYRWSPEASKKPLSKKNLDGFYKFIFLRHAVWYNRFVLKLPRNKWTNHPIIRDYKYTNIYRELDYGTIWLLDNILGTDVLTNRNQSRETLEDVLWATCQYRLLNKVETFEKVPLIDHGHYGHTPSRADYYDDLSDLRDSGFTLWTDAHITLQSNFDHTRLQNLEDYLDSLHPHIPQLAEVFFESNNIHEAYKALLKERGFGPFTSYEVVSDIAYIPYSGLDADAWANAGPGCKLGLKLIFPNIKGPAMMLDKMKQLRDEQEEHFKRLKLPMKKIRYNGKWLNLRNIEHSLCEYGKFWKQDNGLGKARTRFVPRNDSNLYEVK